MQTGSFDDEKKAGLWKRYRSNGALYDEGEFKDGKKVGEWRAYGGSGKVIKMTRHKSR
jgi:antitoxin component YwqK of YwqJK toxin-antitoxin module